MICVTGYDFIIINIYLAFLALYVFMLDKCSD